MGQTCLRDLVRCDNLCAMSGAAPEALERAAHTASERFALALEAGRIGTWHWDVTTNALHWDAALMHVFGISPAQFGGRLDDYLALVHPDDREAVVTGLQASLLSRGEHHAEHRIVLPDGSIRWIDGTGRALLGADGEPVAMVGVAADVTARKLAEQRLAFLARAGELLGSSLELDTTLQHLCDLAVERLADWCSVDLVDPSAPDGLRQVAVAHRDPSKVAYARSLRARFGVDLDAEQGLGAVLRTGRPEVLPELSEGLLRPLLEQVPGITPVDVEQFLALGLRSSLTVPLASPATGVLGALTLVAAESGGRYDDDDVTLAMEVAGRAATAVAHARLFARATHASRTLQQSLLPPVLPQVGFAEIAAYYAPADESDVIGGDFYDVWPTASGGLCMVVGDVSGKGVDAAALTGECRWTLRSSLTRSGSPSAALEELNSALLAADRDRFVTVVAAVLEPVDGGVHLSYACAGHPSPLVRRADGHAELLRGEGQIVGVLPGPVASGASALLHDGDALVLYSDGFSEARDRSGLFGDEGMLEVAEHAPVSASASDLADALVRVVESLGRQRDDRALLVARVHRMPGPVPDGRLADQRRPAEEVTELHVDADVDAVPRARQVARRALDGRVGSATAQDAELVVAELVTNALLHGLPPVVLRVHGDSDTGTAHVEVQDAGHLLPVRLPGASDGLTGRGLGLVASLSTTWGVDAAPGAGKVVWADVSAGAVDTAVAPQLDLEALMDRWSDDDVYTVELGDVPTDLLLAAKGHVDNITREFALIASPTGEGHRLSPHLAEVVHTVEHDFADARNQIKRQAVQASARGEVSTHLRLQLPLSAADAGDRYLAALDDADRYARDARLLTLETPPVHRVFRRWYVQAIVDQLRSVGRGEPAPAAPTFTDRLAEEVTALSRSCQAVSRLTLLQRVTTALTGARTVDDIATTLVTNATAVLEAASAAVYLLGDDGMLRQVGLSSDSREAAERYVAIPASADLPGGVAVRTGLPVVLRNRAQLARRFPSLAELYPDERTLLVAPILLGDRRLGVFALTFAGESSVDEQTQIAFLTTLAAVTATALDRAEAGTH